MKLHYDKPGLALVYFYFDFSDSEKQKISNLLSSPLTQLCSKAASLPEQLTELYEKYSTGQHKASNNELGVALSTVIKRLR